MYLLTFCLLICKVTPIMTQGQCDVTDVDWKSPFYDIDKAIEACNMDLNCRAIVDPNCTLKKFFKCLQRPTIRKEGPDCLYFIPVSPPVI